ncbi:hypothetical protein [Thiobacillus sedimenti]|uniref:Lipoprotein n=1 Tax=Thiobacillus sedimenti TaxID=3110231 RepID=A0ABZ1CHW9_9PROT|nr:hypothetical protein [Thiobacillus sp. SCUT-2]WRS38987.1 hypothetical protein VA613_13395 [Thiobacillus sp. SCUT-2]
MKKRSTIDQWIAAILLMVLGGGTRACAMGGTSWKEEVLLHDGSTIIVERTTKRHGRHEIGQRPPIGDQSVSLTMPGTNKRVVWKDEFSEDVSGANFNLMLLDIVQGTPYLLATPAGCLSYNKWGRPNPPYVTFKYDGKAWQRIPLQALPGEIKLPNMLHSSPDDVAEKSAKDGVVPAAVIREENEGYRQPEFKTIVREAVKGAEAGCTEMIKVNDGWEGLGFFRFQASYEACLKYCDRKDVNQQNCPCNRLFKGPK